MNSHNTNGGLFLMPQNEEAKERKLGEESEEWSV